MQNRLHFLQFLHPQRYILGRMIELVDLRLETKKSNQVRVRLRHWSPPRQEGDGFYEIGIETLDVQFGRSRKWREGFLKFRRKLSLGWHPPRRMNIFRRREGVVCSNSSIWLLDERICRSKQHYRFNTATANSRNSPSRPSTATVITK